jgi:cyclophilin family peptidyl-prolyl cis-trans isomerase/HEAT repeat protein
MTYDSEANLRLAEDMLLSLLGPMPSGNVGAPGLRTPPGELVTGVLTGLEALERRHAKLAPPSAAVVELTTSVIRGQAEHARDATAEAQWALARRLALQVLITGRATTLAAVDAALGDPDGQVRRLAAIAVGREDPLRQDALGRALHDSSGPVRYAVLSQLGRRGDATIGAHCEALLDLVHGEDTHVALLAIDLTSSCKGNDRAVATVAAEVDKRTASGSETGSGEAGRPRWHRPAHALVSLATLAPARAVDAVPQLAADPAWQVRMYTARAAALTGQLDVLRRLGQDAHDNVREAAIAALSTRGPREADDLCLAALARDDYQLLITAARVLEGTPRRAEARAALLGALDRISGEQRETSRDARQALIERLAELGDSADAARLEPYLSDFDPAIAAAAASLLARWTGQPRTATPKPLPRLPLPTADQLADLFRTRVVLHLRGLGDVELRMLAADAPLNAFRFVRLADAGYYDGLTFHRVVPGFVIQGGSPGANEYSGDGPFTRDEIGVPNRRGSVGLSTRGRDTGDAQFYVNLVDNYRLDEDYTVFAEVVRGMDLVDRILEGDVIERAVVIRP